MPQATAKQAVRLVDVPAAPPGTPVRLKPDPPTFSQVTRRKAETITFAPAALMPSPPKCWMTTSSSSSPNVFGARPRAISTPGAVPAAMPGPVRPTPRMVTCEQSVIEIAGCPGAVTLSTERYAPAPSMAHPVSGTRAVLTGNVPEGSAKPPSARAACRSAALSDVADRPWIIGIAIRERPPALADPALADPALDRGPQAHQRHGRHAYRDDSDHVAEVGVDPRDSGDRLYSDVPAPHTMSFLVAAR